MIIDKIGDILHTEADVICHQVNCKFIRFGKRNFFIKRF